jgi:polyisoprenoid-binding protein YceI
LLVSTYTKPCIALPNQLKLDNESSSARVELSSLVVSTHATLKRIAGLLTITGDSPEDFEFSVSARGDDVALGALPFDKMILVSGLLRTVANKEVSFRSTDISKNGANYLVKGVSISGNNKNEVTIPAQIKFEKNRRIINATYNHSGFVGGNNNELGKMFGKVQSTSKLNLVFVE